MNLQPTYTGYVANTQDALILFQATISGRLPAVSRRPHDRERTELVRSGAVFVFNEQTSGIKRWTDGIAWSPSRILGNFLVYRQLEKPFTPGEKKQTNKRSRRKRSSGSSPYSGRVSPGSGTGEDEIKYGGAPGSVTGSSLPIQIDLPNQAMDESGSTHVERSLVGSLVDSYGFKKDGLIKKTMSILVAGQPHHLVSYYKPEDVLSGIFETPSNNSFLKDLQISEELTERQNFRVPLDNNEGGPRPPQQQQQPMQFMQQQGPPQPQPGYEMSYDLELQKFYRNSQALGATPSVPAGYVNGYRPYGQPVQQPGHQQQPQQPFLPSEYYPNMGAPQYQQTNARMPVTTTMTGLPVTGATVGYSPSLPPLTQQQQQQQQGYSYQTYPHEYQLDPVSSTTNSDPRRLPEANAGAGGAGGSGGAGSGAGAGGAGGSASNNGGAGSAQGFSPRPVVVQPDVNGQPVPPSYGYGYGYNQGQQW